jgi:hypothetical protein
MKEKFQRFGGIVSGGVNGALGLLIVLVTVLIGLIFDAVAKTPKPRMAVWSVLAIVLVAVNYQINPDQFGLMIWKLNLVAIALVLGYYADRELSPYARPHEFLSCGDANPRAAMSRAVLFGFIQISRAIVVFAVIHGVTQGV